MTEKIGTDERDAKKNKNTSSDKKVIFNNESTTNDDYFFEIAPLKMRWIMLRKKKFHQSQLID